MRDERRMNGRQGAISYKGANRDMRGWDPSRFMERIASQKVRRLWYPHIHCTPVSHTFNAILSGINWYRTNIFTVMSGTLCLLSYYLSLTTSPFIYSQYICG